MINIIETSREFNEVETYLLTISPNIKSCKDADDGEKITIDGFLIFEDVKDDGTSSEVMSIITPDKKVYSCQSATFKRTVKDIFSIMKGKTFTVIKTSGKNKSGRDFINCFLNTEGLL